MRTPKHVITVHCLAILFSSVALPAQSAYLYMSMRDSGLNVGERLPAVIILVTQGPQPAGSFTFTFEWGTERPAIEQLGALSLVELPSGGAVNWLDVGTDCSDSLNEIVGSCTLTVTFDQPVDGTYAVAETAFRYSWVPYPGYEVCYGTGDACPIWPARQLASILTRDYELYGQPVPGDWFGSATSLADFGLQPIEGFNPVPVSGPRARIMLVVMLFLGALFVRLRWRSAAPA